MTKKTIHALQLGLALVTPLTILSMEKNYPQLQLEISKKPCSTINAEIYIKKQINRGLIHEPAHFATQWERENVKKAIGIESSVNDPFMPVAVMVNECTWSIKPIILENNIQVPPFPWSIPAKLLWNLTTGSTLDLTVHGHSVKLICKKNPLIDNSEFHEQFNLRMNKLYDKPTSTLTDDPEVELVPAGVLIKIILEYGKYFCKWGPNGIPSEKQFALISAKDALAPYGNNVFKLVMQRQIGQHLRKLPIQSAEQAQNTD